MALAKEIYRLTSFFPKTEIYGLVSQMRRAVVAILSNIAEGSGRRSRKEYRHFFAIAYGSALELETQLLLSRELSFAKKEEFRASEALLEEVLKMLNSMTKKLYNKKASSN